MTRTSSSRARLFAMAAGSVWLTAGAAGAQTAPTPAPTQLGEVVVTAERKTSNAQTTAVSVSAFSPSTLANRRIDNITDLKANIPNLVIEANLINPSGIIAFLRGAGQNGGFVNGESAVGVYIDDIYYARLTGLNLDFPDLAGVEVLRGPQGTLYGRNTLTGAIKFNRLTPNGKTFGNLEGSYGSYNEQRLKATFSAPITSTVAGLVAVNGAQSDGFINDLFTKSKRGDVRQYAVRAALAYTGGGPWSASGSVAYTNYDSQGSYNTPFNLTTLKPLVGNRTFVSTVVPYATSSSFIADAHIAYDFGPVQVKSITGYIRGRNSTDYDIYGGRILANGAFAPVYELADRSTQKQFSEELEATGKAFDGKLDYIGGVYYFREEPGEVANFRTNLGAVSAPYTYLPQTISLQTLSYAAFGQTTYHFTDRLSATLGLRYTEDQKKEAVSLQNGTTIVPAQLINVRNKITFDSTTPKFGLDYKFTDTIFGYLTVSKGFQAGGFNASAAGNPAVAIQPYAPETIIAYEAGIKSEFFDRRLRVNIDAYVNKLEQLQLAAVGAQNGLIYTQNAGSATIAGPEVEIRYTPVRDLVFFIQAATTQGSYDSLNPTSTVATAHATHIPYVSRFQGQMGFDDKIALSSFGVGGDKGFLTFGYDINYRSSYFVTATNTAISRMAPTSLSNGYIGWKSQDGRWSAVLSGKNLFDKTYYISGSNAGAFAFRVQGAPQTTRFSIRYAF